MGDARKPELANRYNLLAVLLDLGWDWWRSGPGSHHQQYVQRGTPRTSFADPACGLAATAATHEPLQQFCDGASASPTLSPGNGTFAPSWSPTLPPGNGTSVSCELYYFTLVRALPRYPGVAFSRAFAELHAVCAPNLLGAFRSCICGTESPGLGWPRSASTILRWTYIPVCQLRLRLPQRDAA